MDNSMGMGTASPGINVSAMHQQAEVQRRGDDEEIHDYLLQLDMLRVHCERTGDFAKAQECVNRMREVNLRHAKLIESRSHKANSDAKVRLAEEHKLELMTFSRMWEEKLQEYDEHAAALVYELKAKHTEDYQSQEGILKVQLMNKRPRFSKEVVELRALLERCIQQRKYFEAEEIKKKLSSREKHEIDVFDDSLAVTFEKRSQTLKQQYIGEYNAVQQKIKMGREELLAQRKIDFEKLLRRHANVFRELDQETKLHISKTKQYVQQQVRALVRDPVKTAVDLRGVAQTKRDGQGRSFRSSSLRHATTPPPTAATRSVLQRGRKAGATPRGDPVAAVSSVAPHLTPASNVSWMTPSREQFRSHIEY